MKSFLCFGCESEKAPKSVVCRECSLAPHTGERYVFHDFCEECFELLKKILKYADLREVTLAPAVSGTFAYSCPTKEFVTAKRMMSP